MTPFTTPKPNKSLPFLPDELIYAHDRHATDEAASARRLVRPSRAATSTGRSFQHRTIVARKPSHWPSVPLAMPRTRPRASSPAPLAAGDRDFNNAAAVWLPVSRVVRFRAVQRFGAPAGSLIAPGVWLGWSASCASRAYSASGMPGSCWMKPTTPQMS
jgi:hypothetical protein